MKDTKSKTASPDEDLEGSPEAGSPALRATEAEYRNPWHVPGKQEYGPAVYHTTARPTSYNGFQIYHRIKSYSAGGDCFDIVKDGVCVGQYAGLSGAKRAIDADADGLARRAA